MKFNHSIFCARVTVVASIAFSIACQSALAKDQYRAFACGEDATARFVNVDGQRVLAFELPGEGDRGGIELVSPAAQLVTVDLLPKKTTLRTNLDFEMRMTVLVNSKSGTTPPKLFNDVKPDYSSADSYTFTTNYADSTEVVSEISIYAKNLSDQRASVIFKTITEDNQIVSPATRGDTLPCGSVVP
jgi:hypothetical protein